MTKYAAQHKNGEVVVKIKSREGEMVPPSRDLVVELITADGVITATGNDGKEIRMK